MVENERAGPGGHLMLRAMLIQLADNGCVLSNPGVAVNSRSARCPRVLISRPRRNRLLHPHRSRAIINKPDKHPSHMNTFLITCSVVAAVVLPAAVVFIRSRRRPARNPASDSARRRAVLEDCGDDAVWEAGRARSIAEARGLEPRFGRRMFLKRAALSVAAFAVAWLASRGRGAAAMSLKPPAHGARNADPMDVSHADQATHNDVSSPHRDKYSDHSDSHTDSGDPAILGRPRGCPLR